MKRTHAVIAIMALMAVMSASAEGKADKPKAASGSAAIVNPTGYPIVKSALTLKAFTFIGGQQQDFNAMELTAKVEKVTGIKVEWTSPAQKDAAQKLNLLFASGSYPDFVYRAGVSNFLQYCVDKVIVPLEPYIPTYAPNFQEMVKTYPEVLVSATAYDGHVYGMPAKNEFPGFKTVRFPFVNVAWLKKVGKTTPQTIDEFLAVLRAFKAAGDIDGDGNPDNQWAFAAHSEGLLLQGLAGMFGLVSVPNHYFSGPNPRSNIMWNTFENGKFAFNVTGKQYRDLIAFASILFKEGLIEQDIFVHDDKTYFGRLADGKYGIVWHYNPTSFGKYQDDFVAFEPPKGKNGKRFWSMSTTGGQQNNIWYMTSANKYPEATVRWFDYWYSREGAEGAWLVDVPKYYVREGGVYKPTKLLMDMGMDNIQTFLGKNSYQAGGGYTGWDRKDIVEPSYLNNPVAKYVGLVEPYLAPNKIMISNSPEEESDATAIMPEAHQVFEKYQAQFIFGALDVNNDADWKKYTDALGKYDLAKVEALMTKILNRQLGKK